MRQEILAVFIGAIRQVFGEMDIAVDSVDESEEQEAEDRVITSVGLTGDLKGILMLRSDAASVATIVEAMTGGFGVTFRGNPLDEMLMAALGELSNQISGRAITLLSDMGLRCDITPPAVIAARQLRSLVPDLAVSFQRTIRGPFGRLTVFLGMQDADPPDHAKKTS